VVDSRMHSTILCRLGPLEARRLGSTGNPLSELACTRNRSKAATRGQLGLRPGCNGQTSGSVKSGPKDMAEISLLSPKLQSKLRMGKQSCSLLSSKSSLGWLERDCVMAVIVYVFWFGL